MRSGAVGRTVAWVGGIVIVVAGASSTAWGKTRIVVEKSYAKMVVTCAHPKGKFDVVAAGNEARAKDGTGISHLWVRKEGGKPELVAGPTEEGRESFDLVLRALPGAATWPGTCHRIPVFTVDDKTVALVYERYNGAAPALAGVALYDVTKGRVLETLKDVGVLVDARQLAGAAGLALAPAHEETPTGAVTLKGQPMALTEQGLAPWSRLTVSGGKPVLHVDRDLTWEQGPWRALFSSQEEWSRAAGWDGSTSTFLNPWAYVAVSPDGATRCAHFASQRGVPPATSTGWVCATRS